MTATGEKQFAICVSFGPTVEGKKLGGKSGKLEVQVPSDKAFDFEFGTQVEFHGLRQTFLPTKKGGLFEIYSALGVRPIVQVPPAKAAS